MMAYSFACFFEIVERVFDCFIERVDSDLDAFDSMRALLAGRRWSVSDRVRGERGKLFGAHGLQ